jgi:hypothetical protein
MLCAVSAFALFMRTRDEGDMRGRWGVVDWIGVDGVGATCCARQLRVKDKINRKTQLDRAIRFVLLPPFSRLIANYRGRGTMAKRSMRATVEKRCFG